MAPINELLLARPYPTPYPLNGMAPKFRVIIISYRVRIERVLLKIYMFIKGTFHDKINKNRLKYLLEAAMYLSSESIRGWNLTYFSQFCAIMPMSITPMPAIIPDEAAAFTTPSPIV